MSSIKKLLRDSDPQFRAVLYDAYKMGLDDAAKPKCTECRQPKLCSRDGLCTECHAHIVGNHQTFTQGVSDADHTIEI